MTRHRKKSLKLSLIHFPPMRYPRRVEVLSKPERRLTWSALRAKILHDRQTGRQTNTDIHRRRTGMWRKNLLTRADLPHLGLSILSDSLAPRLRIKPQTPVKHQIICSTWDVTKLADLYIIVKKFNNRAQGNFIYYADYQFITPFGTHNERRRETNTYL